MGDAGPIRDRELAGLFLPLLTPPIALAVSGGADSVALMRLVRRWSDQSGQASTLADGRAAIVVLTVDHGLRPDSAADARWVEDLARALGLPSVVLTWSGLKPTAGVQEAARAARYGLMRAFVESEVGAPQRAIVTAHHRDDQAETMLMRLARGSGIDGLAAMRTRAQANGLTVLRPLLDVPKARLEATLTAEGATWLEDPSNRSDAFERVRVRKAQSALADIGLTSAPLTISARRLARARDALEWATDDLALRCRLDLHGGAFARFDREPFNAAPDELRVRLLTRLLTSYGETSKQPNLAQVEALSARLGEADANGSTLSGCVVEAGDGAIEIYRELGRTGLGEITLRADQTSTWDGRFTVSIRNCRQAGEFRVGALGEDGWRQIRADAVKPRAMPARALLALPAFRSGSDILSVPHLDFSSMDRDSASFIATFCWPWSAPEGVSGSLHP